MLIKKIEYDALINENKELKNENQELKNRIAKLETEKNQAIQEYREEYEENKELHRTLVTIKEALKTAFGRVSNLMKFRNKVQDIIKKYELADVNTTNSNHSHT